MQLAFLEGVGCAPDQGESREGGLSAGAGGSEPRGGGGELSSGSAEDPGGGLAPVAATGTSLAPSLQILSVPRGVWLPPIHPDPSPGPSPALWRAGGACSHRPLSRPLPVVSKHGWLSRQTGLADRQQGSSCAPRGPDRQLLPLHRLRTPDAQPAGHPGSPPCSTLRTGPGGAV